MSLWRHRPWRCWCAMARSNRERRRRRNTQRQRLRSADTSSSCDLVTVHVVKRVIIVWWVVDATDDVRHAITTDPAPLDDEVLVPCCCGGQITPAKPGSRPAPRRLGDKSFCGECALHVLAMSYGQHLDSRFFY